MDLTISTSKVEISETSLSTLPKDLISVILSRLPVKSVLRCKSVCKPWYSLIKTNSFIKQHQEYSNLNPNPIFNAILSTLSTRGSNKLHFQVNLRDALDDPPISINLPFISHSGTFSLLGICNGLVCGIWFNHIPQYIMFICNPSTGEYNYLRKPRKGITNIYFGFGLNGDSGYELFMINYRGVRNGKIVVKGHVYSLTNDTWREIDMKIGNFDGCQKYPEWCVVTYRNVPVFVRGVFYWDADTLSRYFVTFNVEEEVFDVLLGPTIKRPSRCKLTVLKEEVALVIFGGPRRFNIWVFNENQRVWTEKISVQGGYVISVFPEDVHSFVEVLGCTGNGQLLVKVSRNDDTFKLFLYDMETGGKETIPYVNVGEIHGIFLYTQSLVRLK